jgi:PhnB protein
MRLITFLNYGGNCAQAFRFYEQHLGGKITAMTTRGHLPGGGDLPAAERDLVLNATLNIGGTDLMGSDMPPDRFQPMRSAYLTLLLESAEEAERLYALLSEGGEVFMPLERDTFFAARFAMLRDRFGTSWMILAERVTP